MWMMRGQIEDQKGNTEAARDLYNKAISGSGLGLILAHFSLPLYKVTSYASLHQDSQSWEHIGNCAESLVGTCTVWSMFN